jgi:putative oxidoreductase
LIAFVVMASGTTHRYWEFTEAVVRRAQEINFYKNVGIIAGVLFYFVSGPGAWSFARWRSTGTRQPQAA